MAALMSNINVAVGLYPYSVTPALLVTYRNILAEGHANATVNRYFAVLSHAFTVAINEWQWSNDNPARRIRKSRESQGRTRYLSEDERKALLEACQKSRNPYLYTVVVLAITTGARRGELLSLRWSDVGLKRGTADLSDAKIERHERYRSRALRWTC